MGPAALPVVGVALATLTLTDAVLVAPVVSVARAVIVWAPSATAAVFHEYDQLVVPVAATYAAPSICTSTLATPVSSAADPEIRAVPATTAPAAGAPMEIVGG